MVRVEEKGQATIVRILSPSVDAVFAEAIEGVCAQIHKATVLDFAQVAFINSGGITGLLRFVVAARRQGNRVYAINVSPHYRKVFKMVELSRFVPIIEEVDVADLGE